MKDYEKPQISVDALEVDDILTSSRVDEDGNVTTPEDEF